MRRPDIPVGERVCPIVVVTNFALINIFHCKWRNRHVTLSTGGPLNSAMLWGDNDMECNWRGLQIKKFIGCDGKSERETSFRWISFTFMGRTWTRGTFSLFHQCICLNKLRQKRLSGVFQSIGIKIEPSPRQFATAFIDKNAGNNWRCYLPLIAVNQTCLYQIIAKSFMLFQIFHFQQTMARQTNWPLSRSEHLTLMQLLYTFATTQL